MRRSWQSLFLLALASTSCSLPKPDADTQAFAAHFLTALEAGDSSAIVSRLDPGLTSYDSWVKITEVRDSLRAIHRQTTDLVEWSTFTSTDSYNANLIYQLHGKTWALLELRVERRQGALLLTGLHVQSMEGSLAEMHSFQLAGKSARFYLVLLAAIVSCLCTLVAAVVVARTKMPRRWLWTFVALIGLCTFAINWSTGEFTWNLLRVQLFGAGAMRSGISPWRVSFSLPFGAVWAFWHRHRFLARASRVETQAVAA
jgi:hypothetical protein